MKAGHPPILPSWRCLLRHLRPRLGPEAVAAGVAGGFFRGPGGPGTVAGGRHQVLSAEELVPEVALQTHLVWVDQVGRKD